MPNIISVVLTGNVSPLTAALAQGAAQLGAFGRTANRLGAEAQQAAAGAARLGQQADAAAARTARLREQTAQAAEAAARLRTQADAGGAGAARLGQQAAAAAARAEQLRAAAAGAGADAEALANRARAAAAEAERLGAASQRAAQQAQLLRGAMQIAAAGGALLAVGLGASIAAAISFEAAMRQVASIDDTVRMNFDAMSQSVLDLAKELPQSANTLAAGLYNIAGSGFYGAEALDILEISAKAAAAGMTTTDNSAKAIVASLNAYGLGAESATRVSDALFNTVNYGVLSYEELTAAVAHFVGNSAAAGIQIEEAGAALATMTLSGLSASEAGVSLNNMISKLIKPSEALGTAVDQLGINLEQDLKNPAIGLHGVMMQLMDASQGNLKTLLQWFPEIRAARGALALMSAEGENYRRVFQGMGTEQANAAATQRAYNEVAKSTAHQFEMLSGSIQSTAIELGLTLLPYVNQAIAFLTNLGGQAKELGAEIVSRLGPGFRDFGSAVADVVAVLADMQIDELIGLAARIGLGVLVTGFNALATAVSAVTGFVADHTVAVQALVAAWLLFRAGAIITAINALVSAIVVGLIGAVSSAATAVETLIARIALLGGGSLWRGLLIGGAALATVTAGIALVVGELQRMSRAQEEIKNNRLTIEDILESAPGGIASAIQQAANEMETLGATTERSFSQARAQIVEMRDAAVRGFEEMKVKADAAAEAKIWTADFWKFWDNPGAEMDKFSTIIDDLNGALIELDVRQVAATTNAAALASEYGISTEAVGRLAEKYNVDLAQGLDAANENGTTLREAFGLLANELTGTGATAEETAAAVEALDIAAGGAEKAVESLNMQLGFLAGTGINAQLAIDQVELALLDLAEGAGLVEGGLLGFDRAAIANRETVLGLATNIISAAEAQTELTGSTEAGMAVWDDYSGRLRTLLVDLGFTQTEVDALFASIQQGNAIAGLDIPVTTPGLPEATAGLQTWNDLLAYTPPTMETTFTAPGLPEEIGEGFILSGLLGGMPPQVQTEFFAPGLDGAIANSQMYDSRLGQIDPQVSTQITAPGLAENTAGVNTYVGALNSIPPQKRTEIVTTVIEATRRVAGIVGGSSAPTGGAFAGRGRASGGPVTGPGGPTSDRVPIMASDGEWVIRAAAATRYGPRTMAAINAGRALVIPMYASGGPVGGQARAHRFAAGGGVTASGQTASGGTGAAISLVERGAATLAETYQAAAAGVSETSAALRDVVPRMWTADRHATYLTASTGAVDLATGLWRQTLAGATEGLALLGAEVDLTNTERNPLLLAGTQAQTLATQEGTLADTACYEGMLLIGAENDLNIAERQPAVLLGTQTQTLATQEQTLADTENLAGLTLLGVQWDLASGVQLPTLTLATDTQTVSTDLHTAATVLQTAALTETTAASTGTTTALGAQTTATDAATASTTTATGAATTFTGALNTVTGAANAAAGAVNAYVAALNAIPPVRNTTITTTYVTVGAPPAAAGGFARGGMISGPGTGTSDSILAAVSAGEWVIRASAAARQGPYRMAMLNAGRADIIPRFAAGGQVPGYASGGVVRPAVSRPYTPMVVTNVAFETSVVVNGGGTDPATTARMVRREVDEALSGVAGRIRAGAGRR